MTTGIHKTFPLGTMGSDQKVRYLACFGVSGTVGNKVRAAKMWLSYEL